MRTIAAVMALGLAAGCTVNSLDRLPFDGGVDDAGDPLTGQCAANTSFANDVQPLFTAKCVSCHEPPASIPDLRVGSAHAAIVNKAPAGPKCGPAGAGISFSAAWKLVAPSDLGNSILWWYLQDCCGASCLSPPCSGAKPRCGDKDPICNFSRPTANELRNIRCWILQGAPNN